jgi:hypothetical protein
MRCTPEGRIIVDLGGHPLTVDGRMALEGFAHAYLGRWISLAIEEQVAPPPGYPDTTRFSLKRAGLDLPVLPADAQEVMGLLHALLQRPGMVMAARRRPA